MNKPFTKNLPITFGILLVLFLLPFIAFEYLDWWMLAPFLVVGAALIMPVVGGYMPSFYKKKVWNTYEVGAIPDNSTAHVLPYFWDDEIYMGLKVRGLKGSPPTAEVLNYGWELCGIDDTVIKSGQGDFTVEPNKGLRWTIKKHAISLGYLLPNKHYRFFVTFSRNNEKPTREVLATFTVKDRDEIKSQLFILAFGIVLTIGLTRFFA